MILVRRLAFSFKFVKPKISQYKNAFQLQKRGKADSLQAINKINQQRMLNTKYKSISQRVTQILNFSPPLKQNLQFNQFKFVAYSPQNNYSFEQDFSLDMDAVDVEEHQNIKLPFINLKERPTHFSFSRGVPNVKEYSFQNSSVYLFNLPNQVSQEEIISVLNGSNVVQKIDFVNCVLGLPAAAKIHFKNKLSASQIQEFVNNLKRKEKIELKGRQLQLKTKEDQQDLKFQNRRLVVQFNHELNPVQFIMSSSQSGRILHADFPVSAYIGPTVDDAKDFYKNSEALIKINYFRKNGKCESEYYPPRPMLENADINLEEDMLQKIERMNLKYQRRMKYAQNINIYESQEREPQLKFKKFCVLTFSTPEECQGFYFAHAYQYKIENMKDRMQFEFDSEYKQSLLRIIDNQYLKTLKEKEVAGRDERQLTKMESFGESFEELLELNYWKEVEANDPYADSNIYKNFKDIKFRFQKLQKLNQRQNKKSFQQLADEELFGKVESREETKNLNIVTQEREIDAFNEIFSQYFRGKIPTEKAVKTKNSRIEKRFNYANYRAQQQRGQIPIRQKKVKDPNEKVKRISPYRKVMIANALKAAAKKQAGQLTQKGKSQFSRLRIDPIFRRRTKRQEAYYHIRFSKFLRKTINEYIGVFEQKDMDNVYAREKGSFLNPDYLTNYKGEEFISEYDLQNCLQYHRNYQSAQELYTDYFQGREILKSKSMPIRELKYKFLQGQKDILHHLTDFGVVEDAYEINENVADLEKRVAELNLYEAKIGEEYRLQKIDGKNYIAKIKKLEHIYPLDKINSMKQRFEELNMTISAEEEAQIAKQLQIIDNMEFQADQEYQKHIQLQIKAHDEKKKMVQEHNAKNQNKLSQQQFEEIKIQDLTGDRKKIRKTILKKLEPFINNATPEDQENAFRVFQSLKNTQPQENIDTQKVIQLWKKIFQKLNITHTPEKYTEMEATIQKYKEDRSKFPEIDLLDDPYFVQLIQQTGIPRKDLQIAMRLALYSDQQISMDIQQQIEIEKSRVAYRQVNEEDLAKDPSLIQTKTREGYFKVSRFRQI